LRSATARDRSALRGDSGFGRDGNDDSGRLGGGGRRELDDDFSREIENERRGVLRRERAGFDDGGRVRERGNGESAGEVVGAESLVIGAWNGSLLHTLAVKIESGKEKPYVVSLDRSIGRGYDDGLVPTHLGSFGESNEHRHVRAGLESEKKSEHCDGVSVWIGDVVLLV
jgi:hypothetical protein